MSSPVPSSPVVSTQWLADHLGSDNLVILDATVFARAPSDDGPRYLSGKEDYLTTGHIPGAVFADLFDVFSDPTGAFDFSRPSAEQFEVATASVGIDNDTTVVVYDAVVGQWAARIWWLFRAFGYDDVAVLDGGLTKWHAEKRPFATGEVRPRVAGAFTATPRPELWVEKSFVESIVAGEADAALVCALPPAEFAGTAGSRPRAGHIPGSISLPAGQLVDPATNAFLRGDRLDKALAPAAAASGHLVTYCGGGIAAAASALALTRAGNDHVSIYDGSLNEWAADATAPLSAPGA
ncbi:MAG: sulfurtransferase [Cryobacterium sp.]|uniref:sulfurtransferase n=1 Tax=unclassified Cryobacterium TaxID=2649013 RepID=UPI0018CA110F|nr:MULTISPECIES: rhodanese-like domain-containing protein [unclassified Cryobacterium]MCY7405273.1 sulfurtransferase [Cryobacterium sp.]MEC5153132.1 thiosulfate/3-mercaptopyruvate sulfurtransferase [Cryobacterium sp. CAN_C3]